MAEAASKQAISLTPNYLQSQADYQLSGIAEVLKTQLSETYTQGKSQSIHTRPPDGLECFQYLYESGVNQQQAIADLINARSFHDFDAADAFQSRYSEMPASKSSQLTLFKSLDKNMKLGGVYKKNEILRGLVECVRMLESDSSISKEDVDAAKALMQTIAELNDDKVPKSLAHLKVIEERLRDGAIGGERRDQITEKATMSEFISFAHLYITTQLQLYQISSADLAEDLKVVIKALPRGDRGFVEIGAGRAMTTVALKESNGEKMGLKGYATDKTPPKKKFGNVKVYSYEQKAVIKRYATDKPMVFIAAAIEEDMLKELCEFTKDFKKPFSLILLGDNFQKHLDKHSSNVSYFQLQIPSYVSLQHPNGVHLLMFNQDQDTTAMKWVQSALPQYSQGEAVKVQSSTVKP
ncbi:hypothetical protein JQC92_06575 [Shewanella sp. 202IG2-18]|uniref:hypothetical protein n=1 Tax=Parashewanella hymeniacidonis TaxID=2807618 RepID=UPI00196154C3|nr:hypothetical protein [Parashewanella hymeniacidonis]MBM7071706.1 hypothetical protein [Parashewanella hymeniacidonis]